MMAKQRPTRRQVEVLRAYIRTGSVAAAAYELGISETTVRQHLSRLYRRTGCVNAAQAAYWLGSGVLVSGDDLVGAFDASRAGSVPLDHRRSPPIQSGPDGRAGHR